MYLFFSAFSAQLPIVHHATFVAEGKPPVLLSAMQACGALYVKTRRAANFITNTLISAREILIREFVSLRHHSSSSSDLTDPFHAGEKPYRSQRPVVSSHRGCASADNWTFPSKVRSAHVVEHLPRHDSHGSADFTASIHSLYLSNLHR